MSFLHADFSKPVAFLVVALWCGAFATLSTKKTDPSSLWQLLMAKSAPTLVCLNRLIVFGLEYHLMKEATQRLRYYLFAQSFEYTSNFEPEAKNPVHDKLSSCQYRPLWAVFVPPVVGFGFIGMARALPFMDNLTADWFPWGASPHGEVYAAVYKMAGGLLIIETAARVALEVLLRSLWVHRRLSGTR